MEFFDTIQSRRSIRRFTDKPVPDEHLYRILEAARLAPSSHHRQPWHFIVIRDRALILQLRDIVVASLETQIEMATDPKTKSLIKGKRFFATSPFDAPVLIIVLANPSPCRTPEELPVFNPVLQSVSAAITQMHLAATDMGYGGCWATYPIELAGTDMEAILDIQKPWYAVAVLSIGAPEKSPPDISRKSIEEIATFK